MRTTDVIRAVLDLLDTVESSQEQAPRAEIALDIPNEPGEQTSRFKQIFAMLNNRDSMSPLSNAPNEVVAPVSAVTTDAGGGVNGSKHPDDIRIKDPRLNS